MVADDFRTPTLPPAQANPVTRAGHVVDVGEVPAPQAPGNEPVRSPLIPPPAALDAFWAARSALDAALQVFAHPGGHRHVTGRLDVARRVIEAALLAVLDGEGSGAPSQGKIPQPLRVSVGDAVQQWIRLPDLLRALWAAFNALTESVLAGWEGSDNDLWNAEQSRDVMLRITARMKQVHDWVADSFVSEQVRQADGLIGTQHQTVLRILGGGDVDHAAAQHVLGLDFRDYHLGVVLRAKPDSTVTMAQLTRFAQTLARRAGGQPPLTVPAGAGQLWVWTRWRNPPEPAQLRAVREVATPPTGVYASAGPVCDGVEGFRRSHQLALSGLRLVDAGLAGPGPKSWLCEYSDVAVLWMFAQDVDQARWFVDATLGPLNAADPWCATLRETLRLYLTHDRSREETAKLLFVSRNTVGYRVSRAIELLGRPVEENAVNIRLALKVSKLLSLDLGSHPHVDAADPGPARDEARGSAAR